MFLGETRHDSIHGRHGWLCMKKIVSSVGVHCIIHCMAGRVSCTPSKLLRMHKEFDLIVSLQLFSKAHDGLDSMLFVLNKFLEIFI